jgi:hypothetical protein
MHYREFWGEADRIIRSTRSPDQLWLDGLRADLAAQAAARRQLEMTASLITVAASS